MTLDQYLTRVLPHVLGCPDPMAREAIVDAADDFCRETRILIDRQEALPIPAGTALIDTDASIRGTRVLDIEYLRLDDEFLSAAEVQDLVGDYRTPALYAREDDATLRIHPATSQPMTARLGLVLTVRSDATSIPTELDKWREGIAAGALARLQRSVGAAWFNQAAAMQWQAIYMQEIARARSESTLGGGKRVLRSRGCQ